MARVVLDAGALIGLASNKDSHHAWAMDLFHQTLDYELCMANLTYAECLVHPARANLLDQFLSNISRLNLHLWALENHSIDHVAQIRAETGLKMPDALVLVAAIECGAALATTDKKLAEAAFARDLKVYTPTY